jgi:hypothetical protein
MRTCFVRAMPVPRRYRGRYRSANFVAAEGETAFLHFSRRSDRCGSVTQKRETSRGSAKRVVCFLSLPPSLPSRYSLAVQRVIASYRAAILGQALRSMNGTERRETRKKRVDAQLLTRSVIGSASDAQRNTVSILFARFLRVSPRFSRGSGSSLSLSLSLSLFLVSRLAARP